jgi:CheY-like chemotaxis protein
MSHPLHILLVDNEQDSVETRAKWLGEEGYSVFSVTTLSGAWEYIKDYLEERKALPLILLDIMMPTIDDLEWLSEYDDELRARITAPTAGLEFADKLNKTYPDIKVAWHSVRHKTEPVVAKKITALGFNIIQKDLQNRTEFINEIRKVFQ